MQFEWTDVGSSAGFILIIIIIFINFTIGIEVMEGRVEFVG